MENLFLVARIVVYQTLFSKVWDRIPVSTRMRVWGRNTLLTGLFTLRNAMLAVSTLLFLIYHLLLAAVKMRRSRVGEFVCALVSHIEKEYNLFCAISKVQIGRQFII